MTVSKLDKHERRKSIPRVSRQNEIFSSLSYVSSDPNAHILISEWKSGMWEVSEQKSRTEKGDGECKSSASVYTCLVERPFTTCLQPNPTVVYQMVAKE